MKRKLIVFTLIFSLFLPLQVLAVDYEITDATIDSYLQEDGQISVVESFTYSFDGKFNGITREIIPKKGSKITEFSAKENNQALKVEKDGEQYKVHRKGRDEEITVELRYLIQSGAVKYTDMVEFYWPFFDERNESDYENMTITIHPPKATNHVEAIGYHAAAKSESIQTDGSVIFQLGFVSSGENADIRVAYPAEMFPGKAQDMNMSFAEKIRQEKEKEEQALATLAKRQSQFKQIANISLPIVALIFIGILFQVIRRKKERLQIVNERIEKQTSNVPDASVSITATILKFSYKVSGLIGISLLDFIRRGHVRKEKDDTFTLVNRYGMLPYEERLVDWLFNRVGSNDRFQIEDMTKYAEDKKKSALYNKEMNDWANGLQRELKDLPMYESQKSLRIFLLCIAIPLAILSGALIMYELPATYIAISIILTILVIGCMIGYYPLTEEGLYHKLAWGNFAKEIDDLDQNDWGRMSEDDQARAYIFGIGMKESRMEQFAEQFQPTMHQNQSDANMPLIYTFMFISPTLQSNFRSADKRLSYSSGDSSSGGGFSGGGGVGGGGGGSGAF